MLSPGESIRQHLLNKISLRDGIRGTPSRLGDDILIRAPKLDSQTGPDWPIQLQSLVVLGLLARGPRPKPVAPTMPLFFLLGRAIVPSWKKENMFDHHIMGNSRQSMLVCSNVNFLTFLNVH